MKKILLSFSIIGLLTLSGSIAVLVGCKNIGYFNVEYVAETGGTIYGETKQRVRKGETTLHVVAIPDEGYVFDVWNDGFTEAERYEDCVENDCVFVAKFKKVHSVTYGAADGGVIRGDCNQKIKHGDDSNMVTAYPFQDYKFVKWSDGVTDATRIDRNVAGDIDVIAEFEFLYHGGDGTKENPYRISTYEHLKNMSFNPSYYYVLINDIDVKEIIHEPIFTYEHQFDGNLNGNGHIIKNLTVKSDAEFPSLMGFIGLRGKIDNLQISNAYVNALDYDTKSSAYAVGILAGVSYGALEGITVDGKIVGHGLYHDSVDIGSLVGYAEGSIKNCNANISIELSDVVKPDGTNSLDAADFHVGGLIGASINGKIEQCSAYGNISVKNSDQYIHVGGMIGRYLNRIPETSIRDCTVDIDFDSTNVNLCYGGFVCRIETSAMSKTIIENCSVNGNIDTIRAAGFAYEAQNYGDLIAYNCSVENNIRSLYCAAGFIWSATRVQLNNCSYTGSIDMDGDNGVAAGFCRTVESSYIDRCNAVCTIAASDAYGFVCFAARSTITQSYSKGELTLNLHGAGFAFSCSGGFISDCYSLCNITSTCSDEKKGRMLISGFAVGFSNSEVKNSYYAGDILGTVYAHGPNTADPIVSVFVCVTQQSTVVSNCHALYENKSFVMNVIGEDRSEIQQSDITVYENPTDMYYIASELNSDKTTPVWENRPNTFPQFIEL